MRRRAVAGVVLAVLAAAGAWLGAALVVYAALAPLRLVAHLID